MLLRAGVVLAVSGFCVAAFITQLTGTVKLSAFASENLLPTRARLQMIRWLGAGALAAVSVGLVAFWMQRRRATAAAVRMLRLARLCSPLLVPGLAWPLLAARGWDTLPRIAGVAFLAMLAELSVRAAAGEMMAGRLPASRLLARAARATAGAFRRSLDRLPGRARRLASPAVAVVLAAAFYAIWIGYYTVLQHRQFETMAFDLGAYDNMFFNALHGHPFRSPAVLPQGGNWSMLGNHVEPTMYALLPFYALWSGPETLLVLQAVAVASGAIALYRLAARRLPPTPALVLAFAYLLYAPLHQASFHGLHFPAFGAAFTLWALDMLDARRRVLFVVFFALALGAREDMAVAFVAVGLYLLFSGRRVRAGAVIAVVAAGYFALMKLVVMPRFKSASFHAFYRGLVPAPEEDVAGVLKTLLTNPTHVFQGLITAEKLGFFLLLLAPVAFLPMRRRLLWISLVPAGFFAVLATGPGATAPLDFQYVCLYLALIFVAAALALSTHEASRAGRARLWGALAGVVVATVLTTRVWGAMPPGDKFRGGFRQTAEFRRMRDSDWQKLRDIAALAARIPREASVAAGELEHPHLSTRLNCYSLRLGHHNADYVLYTEESGVHGGDIALSLLAAGEYEVVDKRAASRLTLLRKKSR